MGVLVPVELVVILKDSQGENGVNVVASNSKKKKELLHVKGWLGESRTEVDLLVDMGYACNLMSITL